MKTFLFALLLANIFPLIDGTDTDHTHFRLRQVAKGVWAAIHKNPGGHAICNAGIIDLGDKTVLIDPFMNLDAAEELKTTAIKLTGRDASVVINTHCHNDHIRGNQLFASSSIISTAWTREEIARAEPREIQWEKENAPAILSAYQSQLATAQGLQKRELPLWIDYFEGMIKSNPQLKTTLPGITFNDSLWLYGAERSILLKEYKNGHTKSDVAVFLPQEKILFTGDLLFTGAHPWLSDGNPAQLKKYLDEWAADTRYTIFVPGHGDTGNRENVQQLSGYISDLTQMVAEQKNNGVPDSLIIKTPIPAAYAEWLFGTRFYAANLSFLCKEK